METLKTVILKLCYGFRVVDPKTMSYTVGKTADDNLYSRVSREIHMRLRNAVGLLVENDHKIP